MYWAGDKAVGGKMFALLNLDEQREQGKSMPVASFYVGPERYSELLEVEGVLPAPYFARLHWVAMTGWNAFNRVELHALLAIAHAGVLGRLPRRTRDILELSQKSREKVIAERKKLLEEKTNLRKEKRSRETRPGLKDLA